MCRSHPYAGKDSTEAVGIEVYGNIEAEEYIDDLRSICEPEIQIRKLAFLGTRILRGYGRKEQNRNTKVYPEPAARGSGNGSDQHERIP